MSILRDIHRQHPLEHPRQISTLVAVLAFLAQGAVGIVANSHPEKRLLLCLNPRMFAGCFGLEPSADVRFVPGPFDSDSAWVRVGL